MASREQMQAANAAGKAMLKAHPTALRAHYEPKIGQVIITLNTGLQFLLDPAKTQGLQNASRAELKTIEIVGPGLGLYFPKLDVDIYIPGLLQGHFGSKKWAAAQLGKAGGAARSKEKAAAARNNGKLGGRPRKSHAAAKRHASKSELILGPSEAFRRPLDYFARAPARAQLERLAALKPKTLACMHGSAWRGDGGAFVRELAGGF
jgi:hypothetical protein